MNSMEDIIQEFVKAVFERKEVKIVIPDKVLMTTTANELKIMRLLKDIAILRNLLVITNENPVTGEVILISKRSKLRKE